MNQPQSKSPSIWKWLFSPSMIVPGVIAVLSAIVLVVVLTATPTTAPTTSTLQPATPLIESVAVVPIVGEYRGWLQTQPNPLIQVMAVPATERVEVQYWLPDADHGQWHTATAGEAGLWSFQWPLAAGQTGHAQVRATDANGASQLSEVLNVQAVN